MGREDALRVLRGLASVAASAVAERCAERAARARVRAARVRFCAPRRAAASENAAPRRCASGYAVWLAQTRALCARTLRSD